MHPSNHFDALALPDYRVIYETSLEPLFLTKPDGQIVMANAAATELFGFTEEELRVFGREAIIDPSDPRLAVALGERSRSGRFRGRLTMRRKDGTRFEAEVSSAVFKDAAGAEWTSTCVRDVTEESERDADRRWLKATLDHVPVAVVLFDKRGIISINAKAEGIFGANLRSEGDALRYNCGLFLPDGTPVTGDQLVAPPILRNGDTVLGSEFLVDRADGRRTPVLGSASPIRDADGAIIGAVAVFQDLSERMHAEAVIRSNERLLSAMFKLLPVGVWLADPTGRIVRANPAGTRIWAGARYVGPEEFGEYKAVWADTGKPIAPDEWALARALKKGETSIGEVIRIQCFDGTEKTILNSALPLYDDRGDFAGAVVVNEDITKLKETEHALRAAIAAREQVLGVVAHDLRTPMHVILLQAELLLRLTERRTEQREIMERIRAQARRIDSLIRDLLDVTRLESGSLPIETTPTSPAELMASTWHIYAPLADRASLTLVQQTDPDLPQIDIDRSRIDRVLDNLLTNAIKFTPAGGRITIAARRAAGEVVISIADTGAGIPPDQLSHLFDRLWQARQDSRGAGLGLAIAKAIVEAHGGRIWAESAPANGATFSFALPARPNG